MKKFPFSVQLVILTLITVFIWIGMDIYRTLTDRTSPSVPQEILTPVNPEINTQTLDLLKERLYLIDGEIEDTLIIEGEEEEDATGQELIEELVEEIVPESTEEAVEEEATESATETT